MGWVNCQVTDLNEFEIFAFVNMQEEIFVKGRLFTGSNGVKCIAALDNEGLCTECIALPDWALINPTDELMKTVLHGLSKLPGSDIHNKAFNISNGNYNADDMEAFATEVLNKAIEIPNVVYLKYVPDLTLTMEDMKNFKF